MLTGLGQTQIFIEAPYRKQKTVTVTVRYLSSGNIDLCGMYDNNQEESIITHDAGDWSTQIGEIDKKPVVFLIGNKAYKIIFMQTKSRPSDEGRLFTFYLLND